MMRKLLSLLLTGVILCSAAVKTNAKEKDTLKENNSRRKVVMVISNTQFEDAEFFKPKKILEDNGIKVTVASTSLNTATGVNGGTYDPNVLISEVKEQKYDAVIVIGGYGMMNEYDNQDLRKLVVEFNNDNKIVAAICAAPPVLARAGVLEGKKATCFPWEGIYNELTANGATYIDEEVVVDGNAVTGRNVDASEAFGYKLSEVLGGIK
jgi:PfpI family intracellular protease